MIWVSVNIQLFYNQTKGNDSLSGKILRSHDENILFWYLFAAIKLTTKSFLALKKKVNHTNKAQQTAQQEAGINQRLSFTLPVQKTK